MVSMDVFRRDVLKRSVAASTGLVFVSAFGSTAAEPGRGGQAIVAEGSFRPDTEFEILEFTAHRQGFQCKGDNRPVTLVSWRFQYVDDETDRQMFTRDNNIDTEVTYRWQQTTSCGEFQQASFVQSK